MRGEFVTQDNERSGGKRGVHCSVYTVVKVVQSLLVMGRHYGTRSKIKKTEKIGN